MKGKTIKELKIGDHASFEKTITESDVYLFAGITGDLNPAHINTEYASGTRFKERIAHGMLIMGMVSAVLGMQLPGPGTIYMNQEVKFVAPTYIGNTVEAKVQVIEILEEKNIVKLETTCVNEKGTLLLKGVATVMPPKI